MVKESDFGISDTSYHVRTHLGHVLRPGDTVLGYDLHNAVLDEDLFRELTHEPPDVVLVKRVKSEKTRLKSSRKASSDPPRWADAYSSRDTKKNIAKDTPVGIEVESEAYALEDMSDGDSEGYSEKGEYAAWGEENDENESTGVTVGENVTAASEVASSSAAGDTINSDSLNRVDVVGAPHVMQESIPNSNLI